MVQRFDPVGKYAEMEATEDGDYVRIEDYQKLREKAKRYQAALETIATYDKDSPHQAGICPYGCDTPHIAQEALK